MQSVFPKIKVPFAPKRAIQDNILIAHELFSDFQRKKGRVGAFAVKLDLEKAYDFLNWDYIVIALKDLVSMTIGLT